MAVDLSSAACKAVDELSRELACYAAFSAASIRWVKRWQLHITLHFLGDLAVADLPRIRGALNREFEQRSFPVVLGQASVFPEQGVPRVVWLGARCGSEEIGALSDDVSSRLEICGIVRDSRPFRPHLTIARVKRASCSDGSRMRAVLEGLRPDVPGWVVDHVALYETLPSPRGSTYRVLASTPLSPE